MKAYLRSVRIAPKKANLIAKMVRGMPVAGAIESLRRTNKKGARLIEKLLQSAVANAHHNDSQHASDLIIKTIVVNQGTAYQRGIPMARGRTRPIKKFLSHITLTLGIADADEKTARTRKTRKEQKKDASQKGKTPVKKSGSKKKVDSPATSAKSAYVAGSSSAS